MFEFEILRETLVNKFKLNKNSLGSKTSLAILQKILFEVDEGMGGVTMIMSNEMYRTEARVGGKVKKGGSFCVDSFLFESLLSYPEEIQKLTFRQIENDEGKTLPTFVIESEGTKSNTFNFMSSEDYPPKRGIGSYSKINAEEFVQGLEMACHTTTLNNENVAKECVNIDVGGCLFSTNSMSYSKIDGLGDLGIVKDIVLFSRKTFFDFRHLLKKFSNLSDVEASLEGQINIKSESKGLLLQINGINSDTIGIRGMFEKVSKLNILCETTLDVKEFTHALNLSAVYERKAIENIEPSYTHVTFTEDSIELFLDIPNFSSSKEKVSVKSFTGDLPPKFKFKVSELLKVVGEVKSGDITITLYENNKYLLARFSKYPKYTYLQSI